MSRQDRGGISYNSKRLANFLIFASILVLIIVVALRYQDITCSNVFEGREVR